MKSIFAILLVSLLASFVVAEDLMVVCYSLVDADICSGKGPQRKVLIEQGMKKASQEHQCGTYCDGWKEFCSEYKCDADTVGMSCEDLITEARISLKMHAQTTDSDECMKAMGDEFLQCMCVDQAGK